MGINKIFEIDLPIGGHSLKAECFSLANGRVKISRDGTLTYGEGYAPDEAAECFWRVISRRAPGVFDEMREALKGTVELIKQHPDYQRETCVRRPSLVKKIAQIEAVLFKTEDGQP